MLETVVARKYDNNRKPNSDPDPDPDLDLDLDRQSRRKRKGGWNQVNAKRRLLSLMEKIDRIEMAGWLASWQSSEAGGFE